MTGYSIEVFDLFLPFFTEEHDKYYTKFDLYGKRKKRLREFVLYKNSVLPSLEERLCFILSFQKLNPIQELHADLFGIDQKQCNGFIHSLTTILDLALKLASAAPCDNEKALEDLLMSMGEKETIVLLHDGTERDIPRPQEEEAKRAHYSGKKKKHTIKNGVIIAASCMFLFISASVCGKTHDKSIADQAYLGVLERVGKLIELWQDLGYQGFRPKGVTIMQPIKKPKGRDLTQDEKNHSLKISSFRVRVEHTIGSAKRYRVVKEECRLRKNNYTGNIFAICAGLQNFRIALQPFNYQGLKLT